MPAETRPADPPSTATETNTHPLLAPAAAAGAGILVGLGIVATRYVVDQTEPVSLALLRYFIGMLCLLPALAVAPRVRFARRDLLPIAALGIGQFAILIALLNFGLQSVPSGQGALIFATFPLLTMVLAALLGLERLSWAKSLGVVLTVVGVAFALGPKLLAESSAVSDAVWIGELAIFASALTGAVCSVYYRPYLERYATLPVSVFAMFASVIFLAIFASFEGFYADWPRFTPGGWAAVVFIGVASGLGYYLWLWALRHTTPTKVSIFLALNPITATAFGWLLLAEAISLWFLLGLACVVAGLWVALRGR